MNQTLKKSERLTGKDKIDLLYNKGRQITEFPIKIIWQAHDENLSINKVKAVFSVPKRRFKKAVDRNKIKRLIKEAYRINKGELYQTVADNNMSISLFILFIGKELPNYENISDKIIVLLNRLNQEILERKKE